MSLPPHILGIPFVYGKLQPKNKFNQRSENSEKQRKTVQGDKIIIIYSLSIVKDI